MDRLSMEVNDTYVTPCRVSSDIDNQIDDCSPRDPSPPTSWPSAIAEEIFPDRLNATGHLLANSSTLPSNATIDPTEGMLYNYYEVCEQKKLQFFLLYELN